MLQFEYTRQAFFDPFCFGDFTKIDLFFHLSCPLLLEIEISVLSFHLIHQNTTSYGWKTYFHYYR